MVVDRRCYSDGGSGVSPDGFRLRSRRCRNRGNSVVLEIGEQKHARDFEAAKRAMQDRQSTRNCMQCSVDCPPTAGSLNPAALNDTKAVFECLFVVGYGAFPANCSFSRYVFDLPTLGPSKITPTSSSARTARLTFVFCIPKVSAISAWAI